jgi:hypothetical protein
MKPKEITKALNEVPTDPYGAFAWMVSQCASGLYKELLEKGRADTEVRNSVIHCFLDFAAGEACRIARREEREPDRDKWRQAVDAAFDRAVKRTAASVGVDEKISTELDGPH